MKSKFAVFALFLGTLCYGQEVKINRVDFGLLLADAGVRTLDVYSTHRALQNPNNREANIPQSWAKNPVIDGIYSGGVVAGEYLAVRYLERHHHSGLAHLIPAVDIVYDGAAVVHNFGMQSHTVPGMRRIRPIAGR